MIGQNIRIAFFGNSNFSLIALKKMLDLGINIEAIVTTKDQPVGRKHIMTPSPTKEWGEKNGIAILEPDKLKDPEFVKTLSGFDLFIVASYGKIIPKVVLDIPKYGTINIHPSLLPKYRGPSPLQTQILNDEKDIGVSIILLDELVDHGPILAKERVDISDWPVSFSKLQEILAEKGAEILINILPKWISGKLRTEIQNDSEATFTKKVEKEDGLILASELGDYKNYLKYLAYEKWPNIFFNIEKNNKIQKVIIKDASWTKDGMQIQRVIPEGKKEMSYKDFLNGHKT